MDKLAGMAKRSFWELLIRGIITLIFGVAALVWPEITIEILIILFAVFMLMDGIIAVAGSSIRRFDGWWLTLIGGLAGILVGILTFVWPKVTIFILVYFIAIRSFIVGLFEIIGATQIRYKHEGKWLLIMGGIISILFSLIIAFRPDIGIIAIVAIIALYAIFFGILLISLAFMVKSLAKQMMEENG